MVASLHVTKGPSQIMLLLLLLLLSSVLPLHGEAHDAEAIVRTPGPRNCAATTGFNWVDMGFNITRLTASGTYTCEGDFCWETDPDINFGDTAWMMCATTFVMLQTPATGFAQSGLVRRKNALSLIAQSFVGVSIGSLLWYLVGYSLTFGESAGGFIGNPATYGFFANVNSHDCLPGQTIPHTLFASFQMTFALMVPVIITGAWAEKFKFISAMLFMIIWPLLVYYPNAHWIWGSGGWLAERGVVDYAGGITIHTSSGVASLVVAMTLATRRGHKTLDTIHNLPLSLFGIAIVWVGWFSFNGGSGLRADGHAASALLATQVSAASSAMTWALLSKWSDGYIRASHIASGALAGLAGITPGSGFVPDQVAMPIGVIVGICSFFAARFIKEKLEFDDVLDVTSLQAVPGAMGSILVGFFAKGTVQPCDLPVISGKPCWSEPPGPNGVFYGGSVVFLAYQIAAVVVTVLWSGFFTWVTLMIIKLVYHLDVPPEWEDMGLDKADHGEKAYDQDITEEDVEEDLILTKLIAEAHKGDLKEMKHCLKMGAKAGQADYDGRTALHIAASEGHMEIVRWLVETIQVDINVKDDTGSTPISDAVRHCHVEVLEYLKSHGAVRDGGDLELLDACAKGDLEQVKMLLIAGVNPCSADYDARSALHLAAAGGHTLAVVLLLESGASREQRDRYGNTALVDAQRYRHADIATLLDGNVSEKERSQIRARANGNQAERTLEPRKDAATVGVVSTSQRELLRATKEGDLRELKRLKQKKVDLSGSDYDGRTALHVAAKYGHLHVLQFLARQKSININCQDRWHNTPLVDARDSGNMAIVEYLIDNGAVIVDDKLGRKICQLAHVGDITKLHAMKAAGQDLNTADYDGRCGIHLAAAEGKPEVVKYLLSLGVNVNVQDRWGGTPLQDAIRMRRTACIELLTSAGADELAPAKWVDPVADAACLQPPAEHHGHHGKDHDNEQTSQV